LESLGEELGEFGWSAHWIYGGYGLFDNMNAYFAGNGYKVTDRRDIDRDRIPVHHETVWGVADEDLYSLAMAEFDADYANSKKFFAHIMTTSNHRPFTFPEGRVDRPQKTHEGGVQYTDWAIGDFIRRARDKPWFKDTLFVITADHTASAAGKTDLPVERYHIPMIWYAPGHVEPGIMDRLMSQIDVPTTLLGWLGIDHESKFFGYNMLTLEPGRERAFISNYQTLGYMKANRLVVLGYRKPPVVMDGTPAVPVKTARIDDQTLVREAIANYQIANLMFREGDMREDDEGSDYGEPSALQHDGDEGINPSIAP
jgi:phosphoglycerol transferase MdoB-like AlkP superfamily enzyme